MKKIKLYRTAISQTCMNCRRKKVKVKISCITFFYRKNLHKLKWKKTWMSCFAQPHYSRSRGSWTLFLTHTSSHKLDWGVHLQSESEIEFLFPSASFSHCHFYYIHMYPHLLPLHLQIFVNHLHHLHLHLEKVVVVSSYLVGSELNKIMKTIRF